LDDKNRTRRAKELQQDRDRKVKGKLNRMRVTAEYKPQTANSGKYAEIRGNSSADEIHESGSKSSE
jgi:hypothetical protein